jgi:outer membrane protein OmpA-like peptidoglycan-associated protein/opacity protein-like surface antigen
MECRLRISRHSSHALGIVAALTALALPSVARAVGDEGSGLQVEVGIAGGGHFFANDLELGVADDPTLPSPKSNGLFGLRVALSLNPLFAIEAEGVGVPTGDSKHDYKLLVLGWRGHLVFNLLPLRTLHGKLTPFVLVGAGALQVAYTVGTAYDEIKKDTDMEFHAGAGVKYAVTPLIALRFDARILAVPNTTKNGVSPDYELMGGLAFTFGHRGTAMAEPEPVLDRDHDGIPDSVDKCPDQPEDKDGFEDADGCPDPDNDKDGIPDISDKCPNQPENKNGIDDEDGCPDEDRDGDGVIGSNDKCPDQPEDKDGFEDADGCPDPDNDKDGIPDSSDRCPTQPETKNGYQDEDGCPDEVPAAVAKFTGVISRINFRKNSAELTASSIPTLRQAVKVMKDYPLLRIEISGHTSSEGKREANMKLSKQRADAVKAYLVSASLDERRINSIGFGPDKPIADNKESKGREKNRRIEFRLLSQDEPPDGGAAGPGSDSGKALDKSGPPKAGPGVDPPPPAEPPPAAKPTAP